MNNIIPWLVAAVLGFVPVVAARADPVAEYSSGAFGGTGGNWSVGWSFTTNEAISVTALDIWNGGSQVASNFNVRLYDSSGNTLATANVVDTDPDEGGFYAHSITPVTLNADQIYYIAEDLSGGRTLIYDATGITTNPIITFGGGVSAYNLGENPTSDNIGLGASFGPNFDAVPTAAPEPSSLTLTAAGLGLAYGRRRFRRTHHVASL